MRFLILGTVGAEHRGRHVRPAGGKQAKALALLVFEAGRWVPARRFVDVLWEDDPPATVLRQAQNTVARLRRFLSDLGGDPIERSGLGYRLRTEETDLHHFLRGVERARAARPGDPLGAAEHLHEALGHWRGPAFADLGGNWFEAAAARLNEQRRAAVEALNDAELAAGVTGPVAIRARRLLDADPYRQSAAAQLMAALHGEGRGPEALEVYDRVRTRLADELGLDPDPVLREAQQRILAGEARTARAAANTAPAQLPAEAGRRCGRDTAMAELDRLLDRAPEAPRIAALSGAAGVGKSFLALAWAHRARHRFPDGQLYVDLLGFGPCGAPLDPAEALHRFLIAFGVHAQAVPVDPGAREAMYRTLIAERRVLVVLDNAVDTAQVLPLLPGTPASAVVVTSRRSMPDLAARRGAMQVRLEVFDRDESRELLNSRLGDRRVADGREAAERIAAACGGLPLALAMVAARAATEPRFPLGVFADRLQEDPLEEFGSDDPGGDVRTVLSWSYRELTPEAARLFRLMGLHPGPSLSAEAAASMSALPLRRARALLRELAAVHLVAEPSPGRYAAHDLLAAYALEKTEAVDGESDRAAAVRRLLDHCLGTALKASALLDPPRRPPPAPAPDRDAPPAPLDGPDEALDWVRTELPALTALAERAEEDGMDAYAAALGWALTAPLQRLARWDIGLALQRRVARAARRSALREYGIDAETDTAAFLFSSGDFDAAQRHLERAAELCDPGRDQWRMARIGYRGAVVLNEVGRHEEALKHAEDAHRLFEEIGDDHGRADALNAMGWLHAELGRLDEAMERCRESLSLSEEIGAHSTEASVIDTIGHVLRLQGRGREAADAFRRAAEVSRRIGFRSNRVSSLEHLGETLHALGDDALAREAWQEALAMAEDTREYLADRIRAKLAGLG
ncbi:AfsR/SARP family transcriptional regulator [Nocardiopsis potens]|uniref:AfsR/SARP family transcriptional regulator n=1 Tax=Nocardiopsis potens TaxID=1246458 RepID=UPI0003488FC5|nr:BTAD domain-containing putative transcriptional regulator [Nocardiopsis potens]